MKLKKGISSTEFWVTLAAGLSGVAMANLNMIDAEWAVGSVTILGTVYTVLRSALKSKEM